MSWRRILDPKFCPFLVAAHWGSSVGHEHSCGNCCLDLHGAMHAGTKTHCLIPTVILLAAAPAINVYEGIHCFVSVFWTLAASPQPFCFGKGGYEEFTHLLFFLNMKHLKSFVNLFSESGYYTEELYTGLCWVLPCAYPSPWMGLQKSC